MRRSKRATRRCSGPGERFARAKHDRDGGEGCDERRINSIRHGTHRFVGYRAPVQRTLSGAFRVGKCVVNCWLRCNINGLGSRQNTCLRPLDLDCVCSCKRATGLPLVERHASAHRDGLAGHIGIVDQHHDGLCDFFGFTKATQWNPADEIVLAFHHVRFDQ
jgi:hypothetical protein